MTNLQNLNHTAKAAADSVKSVSIMYAINEANKLARKNAYVDNVDMAAFGRLVKSWAKDNNLPEYNGLFSAYMFTNVNGVACYKKSVHKKASEAYAVAVDIETWQPVLKATAVSPVIQLINACQAVMKSDAKAADKLAREKAAAERKAARKAESGDKKAARKALREKQAKARAAYSEGLICIAEFAEIMAQAV